MRTIADICYQEENGQCLDLHLPDRDLFPVFVYFHGGGLDSGDKADQKALFQYMLSRGIGVVSANYRMYPHGKYPDFLEDAADAVAWVFKHMGQFGKISGIYVGGSSAGGFLSQMLCFDKSWLSKRGMKPTDIAGFIHDAGQPTCHFRVLQERGMDPRRAMIDESAPLYHVGEDESYSKMLIIVSDADILNRYEQTMLLVSTLKSFGHADHVKLKIMNGKHCAYVDAVNQNGENILGKMAADFIFSVE